MTSARRLECSHRHVADALEALDALPRRVAASRWPENLGDVAQPGLYSWWVDQAGAADLDVGIGLQVGAGRVYAGQAGATAWPSGRTYTSTLRSRVGGKHLRGNIRGSTFRWTLAAALQRPLQLVATGPRRLDPTAERRLSDWMRAHLEVALHPFPDRDALGDLEEQVLRALDPPLNLDGMTSTPLRAQIAALRRTLGLAATVIAT